MMKIIVGIGSAALYAAVSLFKALIYGIVAIIGAFRQRPKKPIPTEAAEAVNNTDRQIASLENAITAELELADAARLKARTEKDHYKRAQLRKKAQDAENRADALQWKIDKLKHGH